MRTSPSVRRSVAPLLVLGFFVTGWFAPPDPFTQLLWVGPGLAVALRLAYWFAREGHRILDATVADLWVFVAALLGSLVLGRLLVPNPALTTAQHLVLLAGGGLVSGWLAFAASAGPIRRVLSRNRKQEE